MLKRSLVFSKPCVLQLKNCQLVISFKEISDEKTTIPIEDIGIVLIENQQVSITVPLLNALVDADVALIFCNSKGMPNALLTGLNSNNTQGKTIRYQIAIGEVQKKQLWKQIIERKIRNQSLLLDKLGKNGIVLKTYYNNVKSGDIDNREGAAARLYWTELFGTDFIRDRNQSGINALLNYGYSVLRAAVTRALVSSGLNTSFGIHHHNRGNAFPLADDIMEPFRPYVDEVVFNLWRNERIELDRNNKAELINILYCDTVYEKITRPLSVGLSMTTSSLARCYTKECDKLLLPILR